MPGRRRLAAVAAILPGIILVPVILWLLAPGLPARIESPGGFHWVGEEARTGHPLLLREQSDGRQIVAGSERVGIPRDEPVRCYQGAIEPLRDAAKARGRIEDVTLSIGRFYRLTVTSDELGGGKTSYLYRCGENGAQPLLSWGFFPGFGAQALAIGWVAWAAIAIGLVGAARRR